ncbi:agamous-like MADS-box protein AGL30 isoform X2 [Diospyros lotus]|nr:agamous-like MADS-box protein AGL30 isoform X2 [Diospyros lotus]
MGRVKLKIKRLESSSSRLTTYSKRKNGLIKKASELSVLCDVDVILIMFSPSGKPVLWKGKNSSIEGILERFAQLTPHERAKRKLESFDALKRSYSKSDHTVTVEDFFGPSYQTIGDLTVQANMLRTQVSVIQKRLSDWNNLEKTDSLELLKQMEDYIRGLVGQIQTQKENIGKQKSLALGNICNQYQNGMHLSSSLGLEQQVQHFSWIQNDDSQHMISQIKPSVWETELSGGNSFGNSSGYIGTVEKADISSSGILCDLLRTESSKNESIGSKTQTFRNEVKTESLRNEMMKTEFLINELIRSECVRNELTRAESSRLQLYAQCTYPHPQNIFPDSKFQPAQDTNLPQSNHNYCTEGKSEPPNFGYNSTSLCDWASSSGPSVTAFFDQRLYLQASVFHLFLIYLHAPDILAPGSPLYNVVKTF